MRLGTVLTPRQLSLWCIAIYLAGVALLGAAILALCHGHFFYALDDGYIHLALAEQIARGHYGINAGEFSSPSSSVVWPYLLAPFARTGFHVFVPLILGLLCGAATAGLLGWYTALWLAEQAESGLRSYACGLALLLLFSANIFSLTFVGMEHPLQVMLAVCAALGVGEVFAGRSMPVWCMAAAAVAPAVRYEDLSITLAVALLLVVVRRWGAGTLVLASSLTPLAIFAMYLHHLGLPGLPESVLVKGKLLSNASPLHRALGVFAMNLSDDVRHPLWRIPLVVAIIVLAVTVHRERDGTRRLALGSGLLVGALQLLLGQFNWFHRYEVFAVAYLAVLVLRAAASGLLSKPAAAATLAVCASAYVLAALLTANASREIYLQQAQMHRFVTEFYTGNVAVNDLGQVSFQRTPGTDVLDLWGLASPEAAQHPLKEQGWLADVTTRHDTPLVMVFSEWFPNIPPSWTRVGSLCEPNLRILPPKFCVTFYSTQPAQTAQIREEFARFAPTVPKEDTVRVY